MMSAADTVMVVVDVQDKLIGLLPGHEKIVWNIRRLLDTAKLLNVAVLATEQYPKGLGGTVAELAERLGNRPAKIAFSCCGSDEFIGELERQQKHKVLLTGIEAHVCVQQTALDLLARGKSVYIAVDAVGSRGEIDKVFALRRMEAAGAWLLTTEAAMFELCEIAGTPEFKTISQLVQERPPEGPGGSV